VQSRERQRIIGESFFTPLDILNKRTFPDTVVQARSNFDSHGYTIADICFLCGPDTPKVHMANIPYRSLIPEKIDNVIVVGLGISAHRDAMPVIRMQPDIQNMGYAAGVAASMATQNKTDVRSIDVKKLQQHLADKKIIPPEVLTWEDSRPISIERLDTAVKNVGDNSKDMSLVLEHADEALPLLEKAYTTAKNPEAKLCYAKTLGMLGNATGIETLIEAVESNRGKTQEQRHWSELMGRRLSDLDIYMIALGRTGDRRALPPLLKKAAEMDETAHLMRFRSITLALENLPSPEAAQALARLLQLPKIQGHALASVADIPSWNDMDQRHTALRELAIARALYRCGDYNGLAEKTLREFALDLRGVYALHATELLKKGK
jgi:HEAT repeat protein